MFKSKKQDEPLNFVCISGAVETTLRTHERTIANLETKLNLLMGFLKIEEYEIPEVPPTPGIPARVDMRKVTGR